MKCTLTVTGGFGISFGSRSQSASGGGFTTGFDGHGSVGGGGG